MIHFDTSYEVICNNYEGLTGIFQDIFGIDEQGGLDPPWLHTGNPKQVWNHMGQHLNMTRDLHISLREVKQ